MPNPVLSRLVEDRDRVSGTIDDVLEKIAKDDRDPTESERELLTRNRERLSALEPQIVELVDLEEQRASSRDARGVLEPAGPVLSTSLVRSEPASQPVYRTFGEWARDELIVRYDLIRNAAGPMAREHASERLTRAVANTLSGDVPGLVPPQHLAQIVDVIRKNRPIVENSRRVALTSGTLTYPQITQRPVVGVQATQKTELPSQKMTVAMRTVTASTYGGSGDLSWQAINWSTPDALGLFMDLMAEAYAITTETAVGTYLGTAHTGTDVELLTDDYAGWYKAITEAAGVVYNESHRFADVIYASPTIAFRLAGMVSTSSPAFGQGGSVNIGAGGTGNVQGLKLVPSHGLTGTACFVGNSQSLLVAETAGAPVEMRAVEPSIGGMELGVIGAFAVELTDKEAFAAIVNLVP